MGKQLWHTQRRRISRCFGDFSCTSEAIWMLLRTLARLQFIELCPKGTDLIIVSIFFGGGSMHFWDMATHHIWHVVPNVQGVQTWIGFREGVFGTLIAWWWHVGLYSFEQISLRAEKASIQERHKNHGWRGWMPSNCCGAPKVLGWTQVESKIAKWAFQSRRPSYHEMWWSPHKDRGPWEKYVLFLWDKVAKCWWSMFILDSQEPNFGSWRCFTIQFSNMLNMGVS